MENQSDINDESESDKEIDFGEDYYSQNSMSNSSSNDSLEISTQANTRIKHNVSQSNDDHEILSSSLDLLNSSFAVAIPSETDQPMNLVAKDNSDNNNEEEKRKKKREVLKLLSMAQPEMELDDIFGPPIVIAPSSKKVQQMFMTKGFVSAKSFQKINVEEDYENSQALLNDDDLDVGHVMNEVVQAEFLGTSAEVLTQSVTSIAEKINFDFSHKSFQKLENEKFIDGRESFENIDEDYTQEYIETEDIDIKCTDDLESSFMNISNHDKSRSPTQFSFIKNTEDLESSFINQNQFNESIRNPNVKFPGFSTGSGKAIKIQNTSILEQAEVKFEKENQKYLNEFKTIEVSKNSEFAGFSTEKSVEIKSSSSMKKFEEMIENDTEALAINILNEVEEQEKSKSVKFSGFSLASGKSAEILNKSFLKAAEDRFQRENQKFDLEIKKTEVPKPFGFTSASGKSIKISDNLIENEANLFNEKDNEIMKTIKHEDFSFKTPVTAKEFASSRLKSFISSPVSTNIPTPSTSNCDNNEFSGFSTAKGKSLPISKKALFLSEKHFEKKEKDPKFLDEVVKTPPLKKPRLLFGNNFQNTASPSLHMELFRKGIAQHSTPNVPKRFNDDDNCELQVNSLLNDSSVTIEDFGHSPKREKLTKTKLEDKFDKSYDSDSINSSYDESFYSEIEKVELESKLLIPSEFKAQRKQALEDQLREISDKCDFDKKPMAGSVFMKKSSSQRMKMISYVEKPPQMLSRHNITFDNAIDFKFKAENYPELESIEISIIIADNAKLIPDEFNRFGIKEIKSAFLSSPGVDPTLVKDEWIKNAFKFLILKFSHLENSFEKFEKFELLSPENILLHLKYRYDREIDHFHRSCLKRIVQLDDVACKRMILKIEDIKMNGRNDPELILSDGWYSIHATLDKRLVKAVENQIIRIGRKLIISCADLIGCEKGFDPLELPPNVRLKLHANSTRITRFYEKLGFCRNPYPIKISLDSVEEFGGTVGCIKVVITHVYNILYSNKDDELKELINQRTYERLQKERENHSSFLYDTISFQVQSEEHRRIKQSIEEGNLRKKPIKELKPDEVYDLLKLSNDIDNITEIMSKLSNDTKKALENMKQSRKEFLEDEIRRRIGEQTGKFSRVFKFRIVDAEKPNKTALVSWWSASEELIESIKVGKHFEICNFNAANYRDEIQLVASSATIIKSFKNSKVQDYSKFMRKITTINEIEDNNFNPPNCEFDIVCVVIKIEKEDINLKLQRVLVSDENCNFIYINFWWNLKHYALDNVITEGKIFYVKNLGWRKNHKQDLKFKQIFMKVETNFISNPKDNEISQKLESLRASIVDPHNFALNCCIEFESGKENIERKNVITESFVAEATPDKLKLSKSLPSFPQQSPVLSNTSKRRSIGLNFSRPNLRSSTSQKRIKNDHENISIAKRRKK